MPNESTVDEAASGFIEDLKNPEDAEYADETPGQFTTLAASPKKVPVPYVSG